MAGILVWLTLLLVCWLLVQLELLPDEEVRVVDMKVVPNDDYASVFDGANTGICCIEASSPLL
jgi:hypothetical protein